MTVLLDVRRSALGVASRAGTRAHALVETRSAWFRRRPVLAALLATAAVHLLFLSRALGSDEGGFSVVARHWNDGGPYLYGPQWVDRPPGLIAVFALAQHLGPYGVRLTATLVAVGLVAALAGAARIVGGGQAAGWTAWVAFALGSSVLLGSEQLNGELIAAMFVALGVAGVLYALRGPARWAIVAGFASGIASAAAVLVKQNFGDGLVFAGVLVGVSVATRANRRAHDWKRSLKVAAAFFVGLLAICGVTLVWANGHGGLDALVYACLGFRADASAVMARWSWARPQQRLVQLLWLAVGSGVVYLSVHLAISHRQRLRRLSPLAWAITATAVFEVAGVIVGGNYWPHYLIALVPMVSLAAGLASGRGLRQWRLTRGFVALTVATTLVVSTAAALHAYGSPSSAYTTGRWLAGSADPTDTVVVPYSHASVIAASGLAPGYPYSWSLPVRTLDPDLTLLVRTLGGPAAPTWVVRWDPANTWDLDPTNQVESTLESHYRKAAVICGHDVWLHRGLTRTPAPLPAADVCGSSHYEPGKDFTS